MLDPTLDLDFSHRGQAGGRDRLEPLDRDGIAEQQPSTRAVLLDGRRRLEDPRAQPRLGAVSPLVNVARRPSEPLIAAMSARARLVVGRSLPGGAKHPC